MMPESFRIAIDGGARNFMLIVGIALGSAVLAVISFANYMTRPPIETLSSRLLTPEVTAADDLKLFVTVRPDINATCHGEITREWYTPINVDGEIVREKKRTDGSPPIVHEGETKYVVDVELPPRMKPGQWEFQGETSYDCGFLGGGWKRYRTPILKFTLLGS